MKAANDMNVLADRPTRERDGRIARLDEYLDSAHLKPLQTA